MANGYGKRPLWQWIALYAVIGIIVYGLIYYFVIAKKGGTIYKVPSASPSVAPAAVTTNGTVATTSAAVPKDIVSLLESGFVPATFTVKAGTKVTWVNQSGSDATIDSDPHPAHTSYPPLNLGKFQNGGMVSLIFDKAGTYKYHNHLNPTQTGTVVVQ